MRCKQNIFTGITHASTSKVQQQFQPLINKSTPAAANSNANEDNSMVLDWEDFSDDFIIPMTRSESPLPGFVTAAAAHSEIPLQKRTRDSLSPTNQKPQDCQTLFTTAAVDTEHLKSTTSSALSSHRTKQQMQQSNSPSTSGFGLIDSSETDFAPIKQHFFEKKTSSVEFYSI